jgi:cytochrome c-type protein NapB
VPTAEDKRVIYVASAAILSVVVAGLVSGTRPPPPPLGPSGVDESANAETAKSYSELRKGRRGPNASMYEGAFAWLRSLGPRAADPVVQTEEETLEALERRRARRAYAGAPPIVPHPIQQREPEACLACHEKGIWIAGVRAPMMSHRRYTICAQCHAPQRQETASMTLVATIPSNNSFEGVAEPGPGATAWKGAPPTIPHAIFMREECSSCHGLNGAQGLRTPHPVRESCTQCHAGSAGFDQDAPPPLVAGQFGSAP